jgi:cyclopropane fatty-acyl-phospholipid synthase-like methyltransferase
MNFKIRLEEEKDYKEVELSLELLRENMMGPNSVRILEELCIDLDLRAGARILDLGCGKGLTSIFLAEEFDVQVFATDLWITATENYMRFRDLGLDGRIVPIHADARSLPYAEGFFDGIVSIDSFHYFGTGESFAGQYLAPLVKKGGFLGVAVPGLRREFEGGIVPPALAPYWQEDMNFHSAEWWKELWSKETSIEITHSRSMDCHEKAWEDWLKCDNPYAKSDIGFIEADNGRYIDTVEIVARVK